jgi:hypothetical protein
VELDQLEAGDVLTVTRLDRLARSTRDLLKPETPDDEIGLNQKDRPPSSAPRASSLRVHGVHYNHFDRQRMIDYVGAVVRVMLVRLDATVGIFGTG